MFQLRRSLLLGVVIGFTLLTGPVRSADATLLYATTWVPNPPFTPANLSTIDSTTASATLVGSLGTFPTGITQPNGLAFDTAGNLYTYDGFDFYQLDPATGAFTHIGSLGITALEGDLTFDPRRGLFYATDSGSDRLFTINPATGVATVIGPLGPSGRDVSGLALDPGSGVLYGLALRDSLPDLLVTIDQTTGLATPVGLTGTNSFSGLAGLAFDPDDGTLYMTDGQFLYTVNPATGAATRIGDPQIGPFISGLAVRGSGAVPEPSGLVLALSGGLVLVGTLRVWRRRGRREGVVHGRHA
jgi:DNA-binding beta-propeller fold protein YncE